MKKRKWVVRKSDLLHVRCPNGDVIATVDECFAPLIAAAPEMAEMLQSSVDQWMGEIEGNAEISGSDAVEWLCRFVTEARDFIRDRGL